MTDTRDDGSVEYAVERALDAFTVGSIDFAGAWLGVAQQRIQSGAYRSNLEAGRIAAGAVEILEAALAELEAADDAASVSVAACNTEAAIHEALAALTNSTGSEPREKRDGQAPAAEAHAEPEGVAVRAEREAASVGRGVEGALPDSQAPADQADLTPPSEDGERPDLLPCPCCGSKAEWLPDEVTAPGAGVYCVVCGLSYRGGYVEKVSRTWNNRTGGTAALAPPRAASDQPEWVDVPEFLRGDGPRQPERASEDVCETCGLEGFSRYGDCVNGTQRTPPDADGAFSEWPCPNAIGATPDTPALTERERHVVAEALREVAAVSRLLIHPEDGAERMLDRANALDGGEDER